MFTLPRLRWKRSPPGFGGKTTFCRACRGSGGTMSGGHISSLASLPGCSRELDFSSTAIFHKEKQSRGREEGTSLVLSPTLWCNQFHQFPTVLFSRSLSSSRNQGESNITWGLGAHWSGGPGAIFKVQLSAGLSYKHEGLEDTDGQEEVHWWLLGYPCPYPPRCARPHQWDEGRHQKSKGNSFTL